MAEKMQWINTLSTLPSLEAAISEVVEQAVGKLSTKANLAIVFISSAFISEYSRFLPLLAQQLDVPVLIGCSGGGVVGTNSWGEAREFEDEAALSLTLAYLPEVNIHPFYIDPEELPDLDSSPNAWVDLVGLPPSPTPQFILLSSTFSSGIGDLLKGLDFAYPGSVTVGGQASSGMGNAVALFYNDKLYRQGTVGVALSGNITLDTIVAQGCRPIGTPHQITKCDRNIILEIDEQVPLILLRDVIANLSEEERTLAQHSLFVGVAMNEFKQDLQQGDFLIRNILGVDPAAGAIAIGDYLRPGQRLQFHLRDAQTSAQDLEFLLNKYQQEEALECSPLGALIFSCLGRGSVLYGEPDFDSALFQNYIPDIPLGGFFCNGEIGPVSGSTFVHGFTSVFAICRENGNAK